jgi:hypothetical protein
VDEDLEKQIGEDAGRVAVLAKATDVLNNLRTVDGAITATLKIIQRLDMEDPQLTAKLRSHGLIQEMSTVATAIADLELSTGTFFKSLDL